MTTEQQTTNIFDDLIDVCESFENLHQLVAADTKNLEDGDLQLYYNLVGRLIKDYRLVLDRADSLGFVS